jgi:hypothetical protein
MGAGETCLSDLRDTKLSDEGVSGLSYRPASRQLLKDVCGGLKTKVRYLMSLKNQGASLAISRPVAHRLRHVRSSGGCPTPAGSQMIR